MQSEPFKFSWIESIFFKGSVENNSEVDAFLLKGKNRERTNHTAVKKGKATFYQKKKWRKQETMYESYQSKQVKRSGSEMKNKNT